MTATDLLADPTFLSFCADWQRNGRANLVFGDWLEDEPRYLSGQAQAWRWASREARPNEPLCRFRYFCPDDSKSGWWWWSGRNGNDYWCNHLPWCQDDDSASPTFPAVIAWFLDKWAERFGDSPVPLTAEAVA